jgi:hypothetical protein
MLAWTRQPGESIHLGADTAGRPTKEREKISSTNSNSNLSRPRPAPSLEGSRP